MIRLRFVGGDDIVAAGISAAEYGHWCTHVEAVMPDGTLLGAHYEGGVQARRPGYDAGKIRRELLVSIPADAAMTDAFHAFLRAQLGKPYDKRAILAFVLGHEWQDPAAWFCSELQAAALAACTWFVSALATEFSHITPRDLLLIISGRVAIIEEKVT